MLLFPEKMSPHPDTRAWLTPQLLSGELAPTGTIPSPEPALPPALPPRMGDDARTGTPGLFWAGNAGCFAANVNVSVAQGQTAGAMAGEQLGAEDLERDLAEC